MLQKVDTRITTDGIAHAIVRVADLAAAAAFYGDVLGMARAGSDTWPECGAHVAFTLPSGQHVVLAEGAITTIRPFRRCISATRSRRRRASASRRR